MCVASGCIFLLIGGKEEAVPPLNYNWRIIVKSSCHVKSVSRFRTLYTFPNPFALINNEVNEITI